MKRMSNVLVAVVLVVSFSLVTAVPVAANPDDWYVVEGGAGDENGSDWDNAFASIQDAIDAASSEDTINVAAGTYEEAITVDKSLTLQAASKPAVIDCSNRTSLGLGKTEGCIEVTADDVTIQGFEIIGYDMTGEPWGDQKSTANFPTIKAVTGADGLTVIGNDFVVDEGAANTALLIVGAAWNGETAQNIAFVDNTVTGYVGGVTARGKNTDNLLVEGNTFNVPIIENTDLEQVYGISVQLWHGDNLQVIGNTFTGSLDNITVDYTQDILVNHYAVASWTTFFIEEYAWPEAGILYIEDNDMSNYFFGVIALAGRGGGAIKNNTIYDNYKGIQLGQTIYTCAPAEGLAITGNDVMDNVVGIWVQDFVEDGIHASFNNIVGNSEHGVLNEHPDDAVFDATNNWWGDVSGPSGEGPGSGDAVSTNVDYDPWLGAGVEEVQSETVAGSGTVQDTATGGDVTVTGAGNHTVTVATYSDNPGTGSPFATDGNYYDVNLDNVEGVDSLTVEFCPAGADDVIYYWDGADWIEASNQVYNAGTGCVLVTVTATTQPSLTDMTGLPFGQGRPPIPAVGGEAYPVNTGMVIFPWAGLAIALAAGVVIVLRRQHVVS